MQTYFICNALKQICIFLQDLKEEIDSRLSKVNDIRYEPHLLSKDDDRLKHQGQNGERSKEAPSSSLHNTAADVNTYACVCFCRLL